MHQGTHLEERKIQDLLRRAHLKVFHLRPKTEEVIACCPTCRLVNARSSTGTRVGSRERGTSQSQWGNRFQRDKGRFTWLQIFTDTGRYFFQDRLRHILPNGDHLSSHQETSKTSSPGIASHPFRIRPAFISQVTQQLVKAMGINWELHCAYHPQSSAHIERMN